MSERDTLPNFSKDYGKIPKTWTSDSEKIYCQDCVFLIHNSIFDQDESSLERYDEYACVGEHNLKPVNEWLRPDDYGTNESPSDINYNNRCQYFQRRPPKKSWYKRLTGGSDACISI